MTQAPAVQSEVRRCAQCGEAAVVLVFEWSAAGGSIYDYRCQSCGVKFSLHPKLGSWVYIVMGLLMGIAIFPLGFTLFGWIRLRRDKQNPVVPGAGRPLIKFKDGPPRRRCGACGEAVALTNVTRTTSRGLPTGTEYEYACRPCEKAFVILSPWGHCFALISGALIGACAAGFFFTAQSPGWRYGGGGVAALATLFVVGQTGLRLSNRFRHPVLD